MRLIAIDPGAKAGVCTFDAARLGRPNVSAHVDALSTGARIECLYGAIQEAHRVGPVHVVIERPHVRHGRGTGVDPDDLIDLAWGAGELAGAARAAGAIVERYRPDQWKGSISKEIHHARVVRDLERRGLSQWIAVWNEHKDHNRRDAIALALWWLDARKVAP